MVGWLALHFGGSGLSHLWKLGDKFWEFKAFVMNWCTLGIVSSRGDRIEAKAGRPETFLADFSFLCAGQKVSSHSGYYLRTFFFLLVLDNKDPFCFFSRVGPSSGCPIVRLVNVGKKSSGPKLISLEMISHDWGWKFNSKFWVRVKMVLISDCKFW